MRFLQKAIISGILIIFLIVAGCSVNTFDQRTGGLKISEVVSSNANSLIDPLLGKPDWIELCNMSESPINLLDYSIAESSSNEFVFPDINLDPGKYLVIYCCKPLSGVSSDHYCTGFKLAKSGTKLTLSSPDSVIQELEVPSLETDISYGLDKDGVYRYFPISTPEKPNTTDSFDTLGGLDSGESVSLQINEVLPKNLSEPYAWVEILNAGDEAIELSNYYVTENVSNPTKARLPKKMLAAGEYAVIRFTGQTGNDEVPFKIGSSETSVAIFNNFGNIIDTILWDTKIIPGISASCAEDGNTIYFTTPTPGEENSADYLENFSLKEGMAEARLNEILLRNTFSVIDEDGERSAWLELYNSSNNAVLLSDYALSDNKDKLWKWQLPDVQLEPNTYIVIFLSGKDRKTGNELHTNFKLGSTEQQIFLTNLFLGTVQTVDLPMENKDNISYGLSSDGQWLYYPQSTPLTQNDTKGFADIAAIEGTDLAGLMINEVVAVSTAKSGKSDWVEIYNESSTDVDLADYYLSDTKDNLKKWPIGDTKIDAKGYAIIDEYQKDIESGELEISLSGEVLYLSSPQGMVLDQLNTGVLRPGVSRGISSNNGAKMVTLFETPTPGEQNSANMICGYCAAPLFSVNGGYQTAPVTLDMSTTTEEGDIYYTLDGSTPSENSSKYTGAVTISDTKTVRAVTIADSMLVSDEMVATYLFEERHSLPVVCLSMTQNDLSYVFGSSSRNNPRERAGYVEYYEDDGTLGVRFPAGFRIAGAGTRLYPQRSINLYLRGGYGTSSVTYPFFDDYDITTYKSLSLRNMGQDNSLTRMRDAYFQTVVNGMNIENMQTKFAVVYINGKYWGLYEFKENQNEDYLASKHDIDPDNVELVRSNTYAYQGSNKDIKSLFVVARSNTADTDKFQKFTERADSDYFMDYLIAQTFFCNSDAYNQKYAHTTDNDLKWRPLFYDLDWGFMYGNPKRSILGAFFSANGISLGAKEDGTHNKVDTALFYAFYKNKEWRHQFVVRYAEVLNTILANDNLLDTFDGMVASIKNEMPRNIARWGTPSSMKKWENEVADLRECIAQRRTYAIASLQSFFDVSDSEMKELFPNG